MDNKNNNKVLLIGAGQMAVSYAQVLKDLKLEFMVIGRGELSAQTFYNNTGIAVIPGGIEKWLSSNQNLPHYAIVAVTGTQLGKVARLLVKYGIKNILLEKPGGLNNNDIKSAAEISEKDNINILMAYNRRFYASALKAKEIIEDDGGVTSFYFEFTEWPHTIEPLPLDPEIKEHWILHNSSHVIDLAFYLGGHPKIMHSFSKGSFDWHPNGTIFTGAGISESGALFSYHSNWDAPGRWGVEILTQKHRLIFRPLEKLKIQEKKSVNIEDIQIDDQLDMKFKPGLYRQVEAFIKGISDNFITIQDHASRLKILDVICKGGSFKKT